MKNNLIFGSISVCLFFCCFCLCFNVCVCIYISSDILIHFNYRINVTYTHTPMWKIIKWWHWKCCCCYRCCCLFCFVFFINFHFFLFLFHVTNQSWFMESCWFLFFHCYLNPFQWKYRFFCTQSILIYIYSIYLFIIIESCMMLCMCLHENHHWWRHLFDYHLSFIWFFF